MCDSAAGHGLSSERGRVDPRRLEIQVQPMIRDLIIVLMLLRVRLGTLVLRHSLTLNPDLIDIIIKILDNISKIIDIVSIFPEKPFIEHAIPFVLADFLHFDIAPIIHLIFLDLLQAWATLSTLCILFFLFFCGF